MLLQPVALRAHMQKTADSAGSTGFAGHMLLQVLTASCCLPGGLQVATCADGIQNQDESDIGG
jgi:hypothetical protein